MGDEPSNDRRDHKDHTTHGGGALLVGVTFDVLLDELAYGAAPEVANRQGRHQNRDDQPERSGDEEGYHRPILPESLLEAAEFRRSSRAWRATSRSSRGMRLPPISWKGS